MGYKINYKVKIYRKKTFNRKKARPFKFKLKKKFRFWRLFKSYYLFKKKINFFIKLKWLFNNRRILRHQYKSLYGLSQRRLHLRLKSFYGKKPDFFNFLIKNELQLHIILLRSRLVFKVINSLKAIKNNLIAVNGAIASRYHFFLTISDIIQKNVKIRFFRLKTSYRLHKWRKHRWRTVRFRYRCKRYPKYINLYLFSKQNVSFNYIQVNYKILTAIIIRHPLISEIIISDARPIARKKLFRQLYFLY
jgi:hypothetical protein